MSERSDSAFYSDELPILERAVQDLADFRCPERDAIDASRLAYYRAYKRDANAKVSWNEGWIHSFKSLVEFKQPSGRAFLQVREATPDAALENKVWGARHFIIADSSSAMRVDFIPGVYGGAFKPIFVCSEVKDIKECTPYDLISSCAVKETQPITEK